MPARLFVFTSLNAPQVTLFCTVTVAEEMVCQNSAPFIRPIDRIDFGGVRDPPKVDILDPKSGLFEPYLP